MIYYFLLSIECLLLSLLIRKKWQIGVLLIFFLVSLIGLWIYGLFLFSATKYVYFTFDRLGMLMSALLIIVSIAALWHHYLLLPRRLLTKDNWHTFAMVLIIIAINCAYFSNHLGIMWVFFELSSISASILIFHKRDKLALEGAWKYLFLCSIGLAIAFTGLIFLLAEAQAHGVNTLCFTKLRLYISSFDPKMLQIVFLLIVVGFSCKMGLFPFHPVSVDAHTVAYGPANVLIGTALKNMGFLGIFRVYTLMETSLIFPWASHILFFTGLLTVLVAAAQIQKVTHFTRLIGYSSIENMGIVVLGLSLGKLGMIAAIAQIIFHTFSKAAIFLSIENMREFFPYFLIKNAGRYFSFQPKNAGLFFINSLLLLGFPPGGIFISEMLLFLILFQKNSYLALGSLIIGILLIISRFLFSILHLFYVDTKTLENYLKIGNKVYKEKYRFLFMPFILMIFSIVGVVLFFWQDLLF